MKRFVFLLSLMGILLLITPLFSPAPQIIHALQQATPSIEGCDIDPDTNYTKTISSLVEGDLLEIRVSARFGGAVESLTWRGKEFINIWDHGRQISYAWGMNGFGECLNPTEPGSANDGRGLTSTTQLLSVCPNADNSLTTTAQVAYWLAPGQVGGCAGGATTAVNDVILSDHILEKTIEIGYQGIDNVIAFTAKITMPEEYANNQLEIPTGYLTYEFTNYFLYNPQTGELTQPESQPITGPWSFEFVGNVPPILATKNGAFAMGAYSAERVRYYSILGTNNPTPADRTNKWNIVVREEPVFATTYEYLSFAIVGTLEQVQEALDALYTLHPADFNPPIGWVDVMDCQEIAGWAWDPKTPNQPIKVEVFDLHSDGTETLLSQMLAENWRGDLVTALGDNGNHGFSFQPSSFLHDDQEHILRVYAVNSDPVLPSRFLSGATHKIKCPQFRPKPTPTATSTPTKQPAATKAVTATPAVTLAPATDGGGCPGAILPLAFNLSAMLVYTRNARGKKSFVSGGHD